MKLQAQARTEGDRCPFCHEEVGGALTLRCQDCEAGYHLGCVAEASPRRCGVCGGQVLDARPASGVATRGWRTARQPRSWRQRLGWLVAAASLVAASLGIVYADLTGAYFNLLIVVLAACVLFNLRDGRWTLNLRERAPRPQPPRRKVKPKPPEA